MMRCKKNVLGIAMAGAVAVGAISASSMAGDLYTVRTSDDVLRKFDTNTLTFTDIGPIGVSFDFGGMTWDSSANTMYLIPGRAGPGFYSVDLNTGATTLIGFHGLRDLFSLAYDPTSNTVYAGQSTGVTGFHSIDVSNGAASFIGDPGVNLDGLMYDPNRNAVVGALAGPGDLYDIDLGSGSASLIYDGDFFDNGGLAWDEDTSLYWYIDWRGDMYTFDPANGYARSLVMSGLTAHDALSAAGGPSDCLTMTVSQLIAGQSAQWDVDGATPNSTVAIVWGTNPGQTTVNGQFGYCATFGIKGINQSKVIGIATADGGGHVTILKNQIPNSARGLRILSQAAERDTCKDECISNVDDQVVG